jgi:hypothetical protein
MIVLHLRDIPPGVTPEQAAALVLGPERAARDLIVTIRTEDSLPLNTVPVPDEPQTEAVRAKAVDIEGAVARQAAAAASSLGPSAVAATLAGIASVNVPDELAELANTLGYTLEVTHRGVEAHRAGVRCFVTSGVQQMQAMLTMLGSEEMLK